MKNTLLISTALSLLVSGAVQAQELVGGTLGLEYFTFSGDLNELDKFTLFGGAEMAVNQGFSIQADASYSDFGYSGFDSTAITLHAIAHLSPNASVGFFIGNESLEGFDESYYGLEFGASKDRFSSEGYFTTVSDEVVWGLKAAYAVNNVGEIGLGFDTVNIEGYDVSRVSINGEFMASEQLALTAEIGSGRIEDTGSEGFIQLGAEIRFGNTRGTTFDRRHITKFFGL